MTKKEKREYDLNRYHNNIDKIKERYQINKKIILKQCKEYYKTHKEQKVEYKKKHKNQIAERMKKYYQDNKEKIYEQKKLYNIKNLKSLRIKRKLAMRDKRRTNIAFRILCNLSRRMIKALERNSKTGHTIEMIGCSTLKLKQYLESKFQSGMNWSNYGKWHIDHIRPCASFDLSKPSEQRKCFHYTNLQPLWALDNIKKSDTFVNI